MFYRRIGLSNQRLPVQARNLSSSVMSNVIPFSVPLANLQSGRIEAMIKCFATQRRFGDDVFWLKENAELLTILYSSGLTVDAAQLAPYREFYAGIEKRILFFLLYYRFLLSITQDLEALGLGRGKEVASKSRPTRTG